MGNKFEVLPKKNDYVHVDYVHVCKLPQEIDIISYFVPDKYKFRQWFRKSCLISSNISHRRLCVKSFRTIEKDRTFHLTNYYHIIHPFSSFRYYWEVFMILIYFIQLITVPFIIILDTDYFYKALWVVFLLQLINLVNIGIQFISGYFQASTRNIILVPHMIIKNYLKGLFIPDIIANFPLEIICYLTRQKEIVLRLITLKVIFNCFGFISYTEKYREKKQLPLCTYRLVQFIVIYFLGMIWLTSLLGIAVYIDQSITFKTKMWWLFINNIFVLIFSLGQTEFILHGFELYVHILCITFGFIMRNIIVAQAVLLFKSYYASKRKYNQLLSELKEFTHFKQLPREISERVFDYYNFVYQQNYYNESEIWHLMSDKLRSEIERNLFRVWFQADLFKFCSPHLIQSLVLLLRKDIYLANDVIYEYGAPAEYIYFIKCGTIALFDSEGQEFIHIYEGNFFSEQALILTIDVSNESTAITIEASELYKLNREDFRKVMKYFPKEYEEFITVLQRRKGRLQKLAKLKQFTSINLKPHHRSITNRYFNQLEKKHELSNEYYEEEEDDESSEKSEYDDEENDEDTESDKVE